MKDSTKMKTHHLGDDEKENIVLSLFRQVGSVHDNMAFVDTTPIQSNNNNQNVSHSSDTFNNQISTTTDRINSQIISISFHDINYYIKEKRKQKKQILYNISGGFSPGMNAILGKYFLDIIFINLFYICDRTIWMW